MNDDRLQLVALGISHKTATISEREIFQVGRKNIRDALVYFKSISSVEEIVIISTCNRIEFYLVINDNCDLLTLLKNFYERNKIKSFSPDLFYKYYDTDAARHLFKVVAGLDSMVLGEYQVQGQIKDAYSIACSQKTAGKILHKLFHAAFRTGKEVRSKTKIGNGNQSVSGVAFKILKEKFEKNDLITIIGVNQTTKIIAAELYNAGFSNLFFVNRTLYKAEEMAEKYNGHSFSLEFIEEAIINSKCVVSATGAPGFIIESQILNKLYGTKKSPGLLIDMAMPRDINTAGLVNDIKVIDLEGLKKYLKDEQKEISEDIPSAERIISDEAKIFEAWSEACNNGSLTLIEEKIELLRQQALNENKLMVSESELQLLDNFSRSLIHRMKSIVNQAVKMSLETSIHES